MRASGRWSEVMLLARFMALRAPLSPWLFGLPAKRSEVEDTAYLRKAMKSGYGWPMVNSISREQMEQLEQEAGEKKAREGK